VQVTGGLQVCAYLSAAVRVRSNRTAVPGQKMPQVLGPDAYGASAENLYTNFVRCKLQESNQPGNGCHEID
jgi:hypothetical protein